MQPPLLLEPGTSLGTEWEEITNPDSQEGSSSDVVAGEGEREMKDSG